MGGRGRIKGRMGGVSNMFTVLRDPSSGKYAPQKRKTIETYSLKPMVRREREQKVRLPVAL
jgi:hypothetical protein